MPDLTEQLKVPRWVRLREHPWDHWLPTWFCSIKGFVVVMTPGAYSVISKWEDIIAVSDEPLESIPVNPADWPRLPVDWSKLWADRWCVASHLRYGKVLVRQVAGAVQIVDKSEVFVEEAEYSSITAIHHEFDWVLIEGEE